MDKYLVPFRMHDTGWLLLALCILLGIGLSGFWPGLALGAVLVVSLLLHEVGHMLAARMLRVPVREFGLCLAGAYNRRAHADRRSHEILISAAGPLVNLLLVVPCLFLPVIGLQAALCNLTMCVINLLPLPSSDGLRILRTMFVPRKVVEVIPMRSHSSTTAKAA